MISLNKKTKINPPLQAEFYWFSELSSNTRMEIYKDFIKTGMTEDKYKGYIKNRYLFGTIKEKLDLL